MNFIMEMKGYGKRDRLPFLPNYVLSSFFPFFNVSRLFFEFLYIYDK